jgi:hypothetical protein
VSKSLIGTRLVRFPDAEKIVLVQDNLSTHTPAALYEAFPADEARRLLERFEWHYTPKHGSWLNLAESELGAFRFSFSCEGCDGNDHTFRHILPSHYLLSSQARGDVARHRTGPCASSDFLKRIGGSQDCAVFPIASDQHHAHGESFGHSRTDGDRGATGHVKGTGICEHLQRARRTPSRLAFGGGNRVAFSGSVGINSRSICPRASS